MVIGNSKLPITPLVGTFLAGYSSRVEPSTGVHDELYVRSVVLGKGEERLAVTVADLLGISRYVAARASEAVEDKTGIPRWNVVVGAVHTHSGPGHLRPLCRGRPT